MDLTDRKGVGEQEKQENRQEKNKHKIILRQTKIQKTEKWIWNGAN